MLLITVILVLGGNIGLQKRISENFSILIEASNFVAFDNVLKNSNGMIYQAGIGFIFDFNYIVMK